MRLIDADELKHRMETVEMFGLKGLMKVARGMVIVSPTVDAVEVVRCKDCRYWDAFPTASSTPYTHECSCRYPHRGTSGDDFCSWGERSEDGKID